MTIRLRGMTWNHIRGYGPLLATAELYKRINPAIEIDWELRSLKDFGDDPVDKLAKNYDIIMIDHPHVGVCSEQGVLLPLDEWLAPAYLEDQLRNSVGHSHLSYAWNGHQWALAVDAAAQVSAYREELMGNQPRPTTWEDVFQLASSKGGTVGWPLCPTDAMCSLISLCAQLSGGRFFDMNIGLDNKIAEQALRMMLRLLPRLHPKSLDWNPIQMLDHMAASEEIAYIPLTFGYTNYSRLQYALANVRFGDIPSDSGSPRGAILGGVGMAVSAYTRNASEAVAYTAFTASEPIQRSVYVEGGGQPGHRTAWLDAQVDAQCGGFFSGTLHTMDLAYMRPRNKYFPKFQEHAGVLLHEFLLQSDRGYESNVHEAVARLNRVYIELKSSQEEASL